MGDRQVKCIISVNSTLSKKNKTLFSMTDIGSKNKKYLRKTFQCNLQASTHIYISKHTYMHIQIHYTCTDTHPQLKKVPCIGDNSQPVLSNYQCRDPRPKGRAYFKFLRKYHQLFFNV